jgi:cytochrome c oxidase subunit 1
VLTEIGMYLLFTMMLELGVQGMPRRWYTYPIQYATPNLLATVGGFVIGISVLVMVANFIASWLRGPRVTGDPWP